MFSFSPNNPQKTTNATTGATRTSNGKLLASVALNNQPYISVHRTGLIWPLHHIPSTDQNHTLPKRSVRRDPHAMVCPLAPIKLWAGQGLASHAE